MKSNQMRKICNFNTAHLALHPQPKFAPKFDKYLNILETQQMWEIISGKKINLEIFDPFFWACQILMKVWALDRGNGKINKTGAIK